MRLGVVVLPERICGKVEGFGDGRTGGTAEPEPEGFDANSPGSSSFRAAGAHFFGPLCLLNPLTLPPRALRALPRGPHRRRKNTTHHPNPHLSLGGMRSDEISPATLSYCVSIGLF